MQSIGIICFTDFYKEPRVIRTISAIGKKYDVVVYSGENKNLQVKSKNIQHLNSDADWNYKNPIRRYCRRIYNSIFNIKFPTVKYFENYYWSSNRKEILKLIQQGKHDLIVGHGIYTLPILAELSKNTKTIFNAHEYYIKEFEENKNWVKYTKPYYEWIQHSYLHKINYMFCVGDFIKDQYLEGTNIKAVTITNARSFVDLTPSDSDRNKIKLVHHGAAIRGRNLELTLNLIKYLPANYELHVILLPTDLEYYKELKETFNETSRVVFHPIVPIEEIPTFLNQFDIGVYILPPTNFNNLMALPNKFFDFIQARLCLAISPNPEMKRIVEKYEIGIAAASFETEDLAKTILSITPEQLKKYKSNTTACAKEVCAEVSERQMLNAVNELLAF